MPVDDPAKLDQTLRNLALAAGAAIMKVYERAEFDVAQKADASPVTEADLAADKIISAGLRAAYPDVALVTEEQSATHDLEASEFFIVDPLDGTKEFVQRRGDFTVNIALVRAGVPVCGVVYAPAKGRLFLASAAGGAVEYDLSAPDAAPRKLMMRAPDLDALVVVASKSHRDAATDDYIARYAVADSRSAGSSLKFCLLAAGEADFYPRLGRTMEWDTAAGHAVLRAAGGEVLDYDTHAPLHYGKPGFANPFFLARHPSIALR